MLIKLKDLIISIVWCDAMEVFFLIGNVMEAQLHEWKELESSVIQISKSTNKTKSSEEKNGSYGEIAALAFMVTKHKVGISYA